MSLGCHGIQGQRQFEIDTAKPGQSCPDFSRDMVDLLAAESKVIDAVIDLGCRRDAAAICPIFGAPCRRRYGPRVSPSIVAGERRRRHDARA